jgi:hypothetical protein
MSHEPASTDRLDLLIDLRKYPEAEKEAREAIGRNPEWGPGYTQLARVLITQGRYRESLEPAREGVRKSPKDAWAASILALACIHCNRMKEAVERAERAVENDPTYAWSYAVLANVYYNLGWYKRARQTAIAGLKLDSESESLFRWKAWAEYGLKRLWDARETAEAGLKKHPNGHQLLDVLGCVKWLTAEGKMLRRRLALHREADAILANAMRLSPIEPAYAANRRDNARSARAYVLQIVLPAIGFAFGLVPSYVFAVLLGQTAGQKGAGVPLLFALAFVAATRVTQATTAAALTAPLGRLGVPTPPIEDRVRKRGRREWIVYGLFFLSPYGAMVYVLMKVYGG